MNKMSKLSLAYHSNRVLKAEWITVACLSLLAFLSFRYVDLDSLTIWSTNLLDVLFEGRLRDFYLYTFQNQYHIVHNVVGNDIFSIIPMSIWNLPIWILQRFFGYSIIDSPLLIMWSKLFFVGCFALTSIFAYKITLHITGDKQKSWWACFLSASSILVFNGIYYAGQNDIVVILFSTMAIYYLLKNKTIWFLAFSACSIAVKPFFLLPFVALILLFEKNIFKIALKGASGIVILYLCKLLFKNAPMYNEAMKNGPSKDMVRGFLNYQVAISVGTASIFIALLCILFLICYLKHPKDDKDKNKYSIYMSMAPMMLLTLFTAFQFYRPILLVPFLYILIVQNEKLYKINILLETAFGGLLTFVTICRLSPLYFPASIQKSITSLLIGEHGTELFKYETPVKLFNQFEIFTLWAPAYRGAFLALGLLLLVVNYPEFKVKDSLDFSKCERWIIWARIFVPLLFMALAFFCYIRLK